MTMQYDQETRDLSRLASKRVNDAIISVLQICDGHDQVLQVSLMAASMAFGCATGAIAAKYGCDQEEAAAQLFALLSDLTTEESK